ncbi:MFS transporter [Kocuria palustris]|uniref:MFS transporter n=1 Tax=Kocuria palustris TaxID=71999 RepID=UPI0011A4499F|nr:MFS transporter [Kocuria palustris]
MSVSRPEEGFPAGSAGYRRVLAVLSLGGLANFALIYFVQPLLPELAGAFGVDEGATGTALSATTTAMILGLLMAGPLADHLGRIWVMAGSLIVSGALSAVCAVAPSWETFLVLRAAAGVALAGLPAIALAYLREKVASSAHAKANAVYIMGTGLGGAAGRLLPGPLAGLGGWQLVTLVLGMFSILVGAAVVLLLPGDRPSRSPFSVGDIVTGTFGLLRSGRIALVCGLGFAAMAVFVGLYNAVSLRLEAEPFSMTPEQAAVLYLAYPAGLLAPAFSRRLAERAGRPLAVAAGMGGMAAGAALTTPDAVLPVLAGLGLLTFAFFAAHSVCSGWAVDGAHRSGMDTARASSLYLIFYYAGSSVSGTLSTRIWSSAGWAGVLGLTGLWIALGLICALLLARQDRRR